MIKKRATKRIFEDFDKNCKMRIRWLIKIKNKKVEISIPEIKILDKDIFKEELRNSSIQRRKVNKYKMKIVKG